VLVNSLIDFVVLCFKGKKSMGRTSFSGLGELFTTPPTKSPASTQGTPASTVRSTPDSVLYADIPDTPNGPGEMLVSPLSTGKQSARRSVNLQGVKELFKKKAKSPATPKLAGVKRLMQSPKISTPASPSGVANLFTTPKVPVFLHT